MDPVRHTHAQSGQRHSEGVSGQVRSKPRHEQAPLDEPGDGDPAGPDAPPEELCCQLLAAVRAEHTGGI